VPEPGFAVEFNVDPQGSELDQPATATDTVLYVGDASGYDAPGTLRVDTGAALVDIDFTASDTDADTVTLAVPLGVAAEVGDRVYILSGGDIAYDHTLEVHTADGDPVDIDVDYAERVLWEPGPIDPPVPVLISDDLTTIVDVPGRRALVNPFSFEAPLFVGYLSGGAAAGAPVKLRTLVEPRTPSFRDYADFQFGGGDVKEGIAEADGEDLLTWLYGLRFGAYAARSNDEHRSDCADDHEGLLAFEH